MKMAFYLKVTVLLAAVVFLGVTGCAKKEMVKESSSQPQNELKQGPVSSPKQEEMKPSSAVEAKEAKPVTEGEQKVAAPEKSYELVDIHFDFDKYNLRPEDRTILSGHADWLMKNKEYTVKIEGNCDERGTDEYNMALGQRRADEAKKYLIDMGIDKERISTISYGKEHPLDPAQNEEAWAKNRRDDFVLSK